MRKGNIRKTFLLVIAGLMVIISPVEVLAVEQNELLINKDIISKFNLDYADVESNIKSLYVNELQRNDNYSISVSTFEELKSALESDYMEIFIENDVVMEEHLNISGHVNLIGNYDVIDSEDILNGNAKLPKLIGGTENDNMFRINSSDENINSVNFIGLEFVDNKNSVIDIGSSSMVTFDKVRLKNNSAEKGSVVFGKDYDDDDGLLYLNINNSLIENNSASTSGGVFHLEEFNSGIIIGGMNSKFIDNSSAGDGGVFYMSKSKKNMRNSPMDSIMFQIQNSEFTGNSSMGDGGVFYIDIYNSGEKYSVRDTNFQLYESIIGRNRATGNGGVIYFNSSSNTPFESTGTAFFNLTSSEFIDNSADLDGGAIYIGNVDSSLNIHTGMNMIFEKNTALNGSGGAIYINSENTEGTEYFNSINLNDDVEVERSGYINNVAKNGGAIAIANYSGNMSLMGINFEDNLAKNDSGYASGGAISLVGDFDMLDFSGNTFRGNRAEGGLTTGSGFGGAINLDVQKQGELSQTNYIENIANMYECRFYDNYANRNGGAISLYREIEDDYVYDENIEKYRGIKFSNTIFEGNVADRGKFELDLLEHPNLAEVHEILVDDDVVFSSDYLYDNYDVSFVNKYMINYYGNGNTSGESPTTINTYKKGDHAIILNGDSIGREGYEFVGWNTNADGSGEQFKPGDEIMMDKNIILYAQWKKVDDVEGEIEEPTDYSSIIWDWGHTTTPDVKTELHRAYINGYPDGSIQPKGEITRGEVAAIIARLHADLEEIEYTTETKYTDIKATDWYAKHIAYVSDKGLMKGYEDGRFKPEEKITRAEYATVVARFKNLDVVETSFEDASDHWASEYIGAVAKENWITGYPDGSFKPMNNISREEVATMTNKMLDRKVNFDGLVNSNTKEFTDLEFGTWSYYDLVEASNTHEYVRRGTDSIVEDWKNVK